MSALAAQPAGTAFVAVAILKRMTNLSSQLATSNALSTALQLQVG